MKKYLLALFLLISLLFSPALKGQELAGLLSTPTLNSAKNQLADKEALKILSWNIYMLPRFIGITGKRKRAHAIVEQIQQSDYDILVFQEAFLADARNIIREGLQQLYPYELGPANPNIGLRTNSGIWILSKIPLEEKGAIEFSECDGFDDCMARKGGLLAEGVFNGVPFQLMGTHLDAGLNSGPTRRSQFQELREKLLAPFQREGIPQIVCGDMNTRRSQSESYSLMINILEVLDGAFVGKYQCTADGAHNDMCWGDENTQQVLDYVFYKPNGREHKSIIRKIPLLRKRWTRDHQDLSDHFPVEAKIWF